MKEKISTYTKGNWSVTLFDDGSVKAESQFKKRADLQYTIAPGQHLPRHMPVYVKRMVQGQRTLYLYRKAGFSYISTKGDK